MNHSINETAVEVVNQTIPYIGLTVPITGMPWLDIFVVTIFTSLFINLVNKYFTDQVQIRALRQEMKELQKKMRKEMTKDPEKAQKLQKQIFRKNMDHIKHAMNPKVLLITIIPFILLFPFLQIYYTPFGTILSILGLNLNWFWAYFVFSVINSILLKKILNVA